MDHECNNYAVFETAAILMYISDKVNSGKLFPKETFSSFRDNSMVKLCLLSTCSNGQTSDCLMGRNAKGESSV